MSLLVVAAAAVKCGRELTKRPVKGEVNGETDLHVVRYRARACNIGSTPTGVTTVMRAC